MWHTILFNTVLTSHCLALRVRVRNRDRNRVRVTLPLPIIRFGVVAEGVQIKVVSQNCSYG